MADLVDVKLIDGTARTVRELFTGRKCGLDYYQREYTWTGSNVTELIDDLATSFLEDYDELDERTGWPTSRSHSMERLRSGSPNATAPTSPTSLRA